MEIGDMVVIGVIVLLFGFPVVLICFGIYKFYRDPSLKDCREFIFYNQKHKNVSRLWSDLEKAEEAADKKAANTRAKTIERSLKKHLKGSE